jgi:hypothetical protein
MVSVRMPGDLQDEIRTWAKKQEDKPFLATPHRRLVEIGLACGTKPPARRSENNTAKAKELAAWPMMRRRLKNKPIGSATRSMDLRISRRPHRAGEGIREMNRLQKFVEHPSEGERLGRIAYAFGPVNLPEAAPGFKWKAVSSFNPGDELTKNAALKDVFRAAILNGCAVVKAA